MPSKVATVEQAKSVLRYFDRERDLLIAHSQQAEEAANATLDVLVQTHPDLKQSLDELSFGARVLGNIEGHRTDSDRMRSEFIAALPFQIRKDLEAYQG